MMSVQDIHEEDNDAKGCAKNTMSEKKKRK